MVAIFVALMFVCLVLTDLGIVKWQEWRLAHQALVRNPGTQASAYALEALCQVPEGVHLASQHTWLRPDPTGGLEMGADALLVRAVGAVRGIVLPKVGDQVTAGQPLFRLERNGRAVTIPSAMTGRVMAVNSRLVEQPELVSSDPYGSGLEGQPFRYEAVERRQRRDRHAADQEHEGGLRHAVDQPAEMLHVPFAR